MEIRIGCCGWSFFRPREYFGSDWKKDYASILQAYSSKFPLVEVNSSFYRIPQKKTAERWLKEARASDPEFEFTVKAFRGITHTEKFGRDSLEMFDSVKAVCRALKARILLFQTAASFGPSAENLGAMRRFFGKAKRARMRLVWEPRGEWLKKPGRIREACEEFGLVECVDPLRNELAKKDAKLAYFRLHGFGRPMRYNYRFTDAELRRVKKVVSGCGAETAYVLFNNYFMYDDAKRFERISLTAKAPHFARRAKSAGGF